MKRILTLGIVLLTVNSLLPAQEITFSETKFNWGTVREQDGNVSHDFRFVNTGDKPHYQKHHYRLRMHLVRMD